VSGPQTARRDIAALLALIEARRDWAHAWTRGRDCVSFALRCVEAQTGVDLLADIPAWRDRREARQVTHDLGGLTAALDERLDPIAPALAQRGDVAALAEPTFGIRLMVIEGETMVGPGDRGLERLLRYAMIRSWSIASLIGEARRG